MTTLTHTERLLATEEPLVSVIVPVFQGERFIVGAVRSALRQTHRNLEVWVVDDGSTDGTLERLSSVCDPRLRVLRQRNAGAGAARNAAFARASGTYIAYLDCDDRWFPDKIARELDVLTRAGHAAIGYSSHYAVDESGSLLYAPAMRVHSGEALDMLLDGEDFLMPSLCTFDRRIIDAIGPFDESCYHEDHDFIIRAARRFPIYATGDRLAIYRQTLGGRCRAILRDYEAALEAELSLVSSLERLITAEQADRLRRNVVRSLYLRFLTYGFDRHARRMLQEFAITALPRSTKGRLGSLFAKTGVNLIAPARLGVHTVYRFLRQGWWRRRLASSGIELLYG